MFGEEKFLTQEYVIHLAREALSLALLLSAPALGFGLVVGLVISVLQATTQIQEQTLTFVPKIAAMAVAAAVFIPWISERIVEYAQEMLGGLPW